MTKKHMEKLLRRAREHRPFPLTKAETEARKGLGFMLVLGPSQEPGGFVVQLKKHLEDPSSRSIEGTISPIGILI